MKTNQHLFLRALMIALITVAGLTQHMSAQEQPVPPPSAPPQLSEDELEKLVAPIALYPDPLIAIILPASAYPLEIVQAARFIQNPNNLNQLDDQSWDDNVKAVAKFPTVIEYMDTNLQWTIQLGNAFVDQQMDVMNAIQTLRTKAQSLGTLQSTPQQVVTVTNVVVEREYEDEVVYVTNTVVEIQPVNPQIVYVPVYNPVYVYYPPPGYVYYPSYAPPVYVVNTFSFYRCDWYYGGVYYGRSGLIFWTGRGAYHPPYYPRPPGFYRPPPYRPPPGYRPPPPGGGSNGNRPNPGTTPEKPASGNRPPSGNQPGNGSNGNRPNNGTGGNRPAPGNGQNNPPQSPSPGAPPSNNRPSQPPPSTGNRPPPSGGSRDSAFGGVGNGSGARDSSNRGAASRGGSRPGGGGGGRPAGGRQ